MEFIFFKAALKFLPIRKVLSSFAVEKSICPISLILNFVGCPIKLAVTCLLSFIKSTDILRTIRPPECALPVPSPRFELALVNIVLLSIPPIDSTPILFISLELSQIVITCWIVQLSKPLSFPINKLTINNSFPIIQVAQSFSMRFAFLHFSDVNWLVILKDSWLIKVRLVV